MPNLSEIEMLEEHEITPNLAEIEILDWTWGIVIMLIPAYSGWSWGLPKISQEIPWLCLTTRSNKLQEKPLEVELNLGDFFGYKKWKTSLCSYCRIASSCWAIAIILRLHCRWYIWRKREANHVQTVSTHSLNPFKVEALKSWKDGGEWKSLDSSLLASTSWPLS